MKHPKPVPLETMRVWRDTVAKAQTDDYELPWWVIAAGYFVAGFLWGRVFAPVLMRDPPKLSLERLRRQRDHLDLTIKHLEDQKVS